MILLACLTNTSNAQKNKWVKLFDGQTTNGWHSYGKSTAGSAWKVVDGALFLDAKAVKNDGGDLVTDKEYGNFHLKLEWKISPKGNSGIIFYVHEALPKFNNTYSTGPEMQVLDNDGHSDGKITKHRAGDLYDLIQSTSEPVKPVGAWNQAEIISKNGKLEFKLNGKSIVRTTLWDDQWKSLIAGSKFAKWPGFGTFQHGKIALQDHGDEVWYRNIEIKEL